MLVSVLGFGGSEIGYRRVAKSRVARLLQAALDAGLNVLDTAECYEASEALIGEAVAARRDEYFLFTKCGHPHAFSRPDWGPRSLLTQIERSLERLRTDHVDLIQLHSCEEPVLRRGEVIEALDRARERGLARYIGYSGDGAAARYAVECGRFDTLQTSVSIADQEALDLTLPLARTRGLGIIAKRPIANVAWRSARRPTEPYYRPYWERLRVLDYDFLSRPLAEAVASALRFTLSVPGVATAIVGTTNPDHWRENATRLEAGGLPPAIFETLRARWREVADATWVGQV
jgi:aryl-alcohol dehydrogenase-like predicted oxidoreductase